MYAHLKVKLQKQHLHSYESRIIVEDLRNYFFKKRDVHLCVYTYL